MNFYKVDKFIYDQVMKDFSVSVKPEVIDRIVDDRYKDYVYIAIPKDEVDNKILLKKLSNGSMGYVEPWILEILKEASIVELDYLTYKGCSDKVWKEGDDKKLVLSEQTMTALLSESSLDKGVDSEFISFLLANGINDSTGYSIIAQVLQSKIEDSWIMPKIIKEIFFNRKGPQFISLLNLLVSDDDPTGVAAVSFSIKEDKVFAAITLCIDPLLKVRCNIFFNSLDSRDVKIMFTYVSASPTLSDGIGLAILTRKCDCSWEVKISDTLERSFSSIFNGGRVRSREEIHKSLTKSLQENNINNFNISFYEDFLQCDF